MKIKNRQSMSAAATIAALVTLVTLATLVTLVTLGCAKEKSESAAPGTAQQTTPEAAAPGETEAAVTPAGSVQGIWSQIAEEQGKLSVAVQNGQLKDVHLLAFGIRDLVVALTDKAGASSPSVAPKVKGLVEEVRASATKLDELGDAGDLSGTQAEVGKLENTLAAIKALTSTQ